MSLEINGEPSVNREDWKQEAHRFGADRFGLPSNNFEHHCLNLDKLNSEELSRALDGTEHQPELSFFDVVQTRAEPANCKAGSKDGTVAEMFKLLPYLLLVKIWMLCSERFKSYRSLAPDSWQRIQYVGLEKGEGDKSFNGYRWLVKLSTFCKWYIRSIRPTLRRELKPNKVRTYGFKLKHCTLDIAFVIAHCLRHSDRWKGFHLAWSSQDIETAFGKLRHDSMQSSLQSYGASIRTVQAIMQELHNYKAAVLIPGCEESQEFPHQCGGHQGWVQTPDLFNCLIDSVFWSLM